MANAFFPHSAFPLPNSLTPNPLYETTFTKICQTEQIAVEPSTSSGEQTAPTIYNSAMNLCSFFFD